MLNLGIVLLLNSDFKNTMVDLGGRLIFKGTV